MYIVSSSPINVDYAMQITVNIEHFMSVVEEIVSSVAFCMVDAM